MITAVTVALVSMIFGQVWLILLQPRYILDWIGPYIDRLTPRLRKLFTCATCMAGQCALWSYPFSAESYSVAWHGVAVIAAIWITHLTTRHVIDEP